MKKTYKLIFMCMMTVLACRVYAEPDQHWIDNKVRDFLKDKPVKAMIYGVWVNGKLISIQAAGESMTAVPATKKMHFRIGGITETMLTTLLMQMVEKKKVSLDDKVEQWYPDLPNANQVTLKMLANGTSGYPDYVYNKKFVDMAVNNPFKHWSNSELLEYAFAEAALFKPGTSQRYSHTDYVILGSILTKVGGKPLNELLQTYILKPLKMKETAFNLTAVMAAPVLHSFSQDRLVYEDATFWDPSWTASSGAMVSTMEDLGRWANAWMKGSLISQQSTQTLRAPDTIGKGKNTADRYFAMGFGNIHHWLVQNPRFGGYSGIFAVLPEKNIVFIAFNTLQASESDQPNYSMALWQALYLNS